LGLTLLATVDATTSYPSYTSRSSLGTGLRSCIGGCNSLIFGYAPWGNDGTRYACPAAGNWIVNDGSACTDIDKWDVTDNSDMNSVFLNARSFNQDLTFWDTSKVVYFHSTFRDAWQFNGDITLWDVSKAVHMSQMFFNARNFNQDISAWDITKVRQFLYFMTIEGGHLVRFNHDISAWKPYHATNQGGFIRDDNTPSNYPFELCHGGLWVTQYGNNGNFVKVVTKRMAPWGTDPDCPCPHNLCGDITHNTGGVCHTTSTNSMGACTCTAPFLGTHCRDIKCPPGTQIMEYYPWDGTSPCEECPDGKMSEYGGTCEDSCRTLLTQDGKKCVYKPVNSNQVRSDGRVDGSQAFINSWLDENEVSAWDLSLLTSMDSLFYGLCNPSSDFNRDITMWDVSHVTRMSGMFSKNVGFNQDISHWNVANVENMASMFRAAFHFNQDISAWDVSSVTNFGGFMQMGGTSHNQPQFCYTSNSQSWGYTSANRKSHMKHKFDGAAWIAKASSMPNEAFMGQWDFPSDKGIGTSVDMCPHNECLEAFHGAGSCDNGVCTCAPGFLGARCRQCSFGAGKGRGDCLCLPGLETLGDGCKNTTMSDSAFLDILGLVRAERSKTLRKAKRPTRDPTKSFKENVVKLPIQKDDLSVEQETLVQEMEAAFGGTVELKLSVAAEQTAPLATPTADQCTFDLNEQEPGKKTVVHAYDVGNYVYICDTASGAMKFVAEVKETETGSAVRCWDATASGGSGAWGSTANKNAGESHTCNDTPLLIGSVTAQCGPGLGCCSSDHCENGDCINNVCVCEAGFEGETCAQPSECKDITVSDTYQKKGCCNC